MKNKDTQKELAQIRARHKEMAELREQAPFHLPNNIRRNTIKFIDSVLTRLVEFESELLEKQK